MKTLYLSELLNKTFETVEELEAAEKEYNDKKAEKEALKAERKRRAEEVEEAYKKKIEAAKEYNEILKKFLEDYKSYHFTYTKGNINNTPLFDEVLTKFFNL